MKQLDPKAIWLFFFRDIHIVFSLFLGITIFFVMYYLSSTNLDDTKTIEIKASFILTYLLLGIFFVFLIAFIRAKLSYNYYKYQLTDSGFIKERGIITKKYTTIPYDRIQNIDIYRGISSRILGLSTLQIQTAGTGIAGTAEGTLPGLSIETAEELREDLIKRAQILKDREL